MLFLYVLFTILTSHLLTSHAEYYHVNKSGWVILCRSWLWPITWPVIFYKQIKGHPFEEEDNPPSVVVAI